MEEIIDELYEIYIKIEQDSEIKREDVTPELRIKEDLGLNSIGLLYLVMGIEKAFCISLKNSSIETFVTIGDVAKYLEENA